MLREATHRDYDDARRSIQLVANWEPEFGSGQARPRTSHQRPAFRTGQRRALRFHACRPRPVQGGAVEQPTQAAMLIVDHILSAIGKHTVTPTFAPVKVPVVVVPPNPVQSVSVSIDGRLAGLTETITDVGELATQQYAAIFPHVLARTVVRRSAKRDRCTPRRNSGKSGIRWVNSPSTPSGSPGKRPKTPTHAAGDCCQTKFKSAASSFPLVLINSLCSRPTRPANRSAAVNRPNCKSSTLATPTCSRTFRVPQWLADCS